ncbi:hypothetical protein ACFLUZ_06655 [Chloroflexota bacterium]
MNDLYKLITWLSTKEKAAQERVSEKTVLRRVKAGLYPGAYQVSKKSEWRFPSDDSAIPNKVMSPLEIAVQAKKGQKILSHFHELRQTTLLWEEQIYLPLPWRWDITDLRQVFYKVKNETITGYKLPGDLRDNELSQGHVRQIGDSKVRWTIREDGTVFLETSVETTPGFQSLYSHVPMSRAWGLYTEWKHLGGTYIQDCTSLLHRIHQDVSRSINSDSDLVSWVIYHDAFCVKETKNRCKVCGAKNPADPRHCSACRLPLDTLKPIATEFEQQNMPNEKKVPLRIRGWGNLDDSVDIERIEGVTRGGKALRDKYLGCGMVQRILKSETEARSIHDRLLSSVQEIAQQEIFEGQCGHCPFDSNIK